MADYFPVPNEFDGWDAVNLELIAFPVEPSPATEQSWWEDLGGGADYESVRKRNERVDVGQFNGAALQLTLDLLRIRWAIAPWLTVEAAEGLSAQPIIGPYGAVLPWFQLLMSRWLVGGCPPIKRLAFAAKVMRAAEGKAGAYQELTKLLPSLPIDSDANDFQYRINRPRTSQVLDGLLINRLTTWSAFSIDIRMHVSVAGEPNSVLQEFTGALLQLDMNTPAGRTDPIPQDRLPELWNELISLGNETIRCGDVK